MWTSQGKDHAGGVKDLKGCVLRGEGESLRMGWVSEGIPSLGPRERLKP